MLHSGRLGQCRSFGESGRRWREVIAMVMVWGPRGSGDAGEGAEGGGGGGLGGGIRDEVGVGTWEAGRICGLRGRRVEFEELTRSRVLRLCCSRGFC